MRKLLIFFTFFALAVSVLAQSGEIEQEMLVFGDLRAVNALVGVGPVDVYVSGQVIGVGLEPEKATPYLSLPPGRYEVAVYLAGADPLSTPIADVLLDLPDGQSKTVIAYQTRFAQPDNTGFEAKLEGEALFAQTGSMIVLDDNRSPLTLGKTRLTAVHLAEGNPGKLSIGYPSRASLLYEVALATPYGDIDIDSGVYPLTIIDAESESLDRLAFIGDRTFNANMHYTLVMIPDLSYNPDKPQLSPLVNRPRLFVVGAPIEPPDNGLQLRLIHAAPDTTITDVYIDGKLVAPRLTYGEFTEYLGLQNFSHLIELRRRDAAPDSEPLATATLEISQENRNQRTWTLMLLNGGNNSDVPALGLSQAQQPVGLDPNAPEKPPQIFNTSGGQMMMVLVPDNIAQTPRGQARLRVLHAIDGALEISLWTPGFPLQPTDPTPIPDATPAPPIQLTDPVIYGAEANEGQVPAGLYKELDFIAGNRTSLVTLTNKELLPGMVYTFVLIGLPSGEPPIQALEIDDFGHGVPQARLYVGVIASEVGVANIRSQPSNSANVQGQLDTGAEVEVLGRNFNGSWIKIRYTESGNPVAQEGWIFGTIINVSRLGVPINALALPEVNP